jgi:pimeloyl-ACP methyl ester carboxylesterase
MKTTLGLLLILAMLAGNRKTASAQHDCPGPADKTDTWFNVPTKTLGGKQLWTDYVHLHGYRIQRNVMTGHHRLLDPADVRLAWGNIAGCQQELARVADEQRLPPMTGRVAIVLHGLTRTRASMKPLASHLSENSDVTVINLSYASTRSSIDQHAAALASIIEHLPQVREIDFVGHSMGNIVVRYYLGQLRSQRDPRFRRMVMLAPPNQGSRLARLLQDNLLFRTFWGISGQDLSRRWPEIERHLATPDFEFGIIAGNRPDEATLDNPLIRNNNDLVVTVDETRLPGARDFIQRDLLHSTMMKEPAVHEATLSFLEHGYFVSADQRQPIPVEAGQ